MTRKDDSLPQPEPEAATRSGMRVAASPLNEVKLDLAIIVVVLLLLWLVLANTATDTVTQMLILFLSSGIAASWIVFRVRRILHRHGGD